MEKLLPLEHLEITDYTIEPSIESFAADHTELAYTTTRQRLFEERARLMFQKYNLSVDPEDMPLYMLTKDEPVERVHKPIRIRVHRYCHRCETVFPSSDKVCASCKHTRCKKCPRYPREQESAGGEQMEASEESDGREPLRMVQNPRKNTLLVHKPPVQRIRRKCHKCDTYFSTATTTACANCGHTRCTKCPRNPEKKTKWTLGYPGDARPSSDEDENGVQRHIVRQERVFREIRQRVRWNCEQCESVFLEGSTTCRDCGHTRCDDCDRQPPKRSHEDLGHPSAESLHHRLETLAVGG